MKILILTQYFVPETNAPAHRLGFFAKYLARKGNEVTVICEPPNYPKGILFDGYKNKIIQEEYLDGVRIIRSWVWITQRKGFIHRILNYFSFFFSSLVASLKARKPDIVFATSPPLPVIFSGAIISKFRKIPLVVDIRDIWPDSALEVGMMKKNIIFQILEKIEKAIYRQSVKIVVNAKGIGKRLIKGKGVSQNKLTLLTNGAELEFFRPDVDFSIIDKRYGIHGKFVALYTGLLGLAQAPEIIIETANFLKNHNDIIFLIVGEGALKQKCEELVKNYNLRNVIFTGERPRNEMPLFAGRANVAIIPYKNSELFKDVLPSKMFDYMAAGKPLIINLDGEGAEIIKKADCGFVAQPENPKSLAEKIMTIYKNKKRAIRLGMNGRKYVELYYNRENISEKLNSLLNSIVKIST